MPLDKVMAPAIRLAEQRLHRRHARSRNRFAETRSASRVRGRRGVHAERTSARASGTMFRQPALASTLRAIAANGARRILHGAGRQCDRRRDEARRRHHHRRMISRRYAPLWHTPLSGTYRGYTLLTMPPSSSGGITVLETLNILEQFQPTRASGAALSTTFSAEHFGVRSSIATRSSAIPRS